MEHGENADTPSASKANPGDSKGVVRSGELSGDEKDGTVSSHQGQDEGDTSSSSDESSTQGSNDRTSSISAAGKTKADSSATAGQEASGLGRALEPQRVAASSLTAGAMATMQRGEVPGRGEVQGTPAQHARRAQADGADVGPFVRRSANLFAARGRFRRQPPTEIESDEDKKARFWAGVKPTRKNSVLFGIPKLQDANGTGGLTMATLRAAIKLKKKANVIHAKSELTGYILDPRSLRMRYWKNWMLVNIMYSILMVPGLISFNSEPGALLLTLNGIVNVSFVIDTALHFLTAVPMESGLVTDRGFICRRYILTWFVLDVASCLPVTTLLRNRLSPSWQILAPLRGLRLLGLLKVVKVYTLHYEVSPVAMSIGKTLVTVILAAHLLSCLWYWIHCSDAEAEGFPKPWEQCGHSTSTASQYLSSFYFIIYTMMTVGYGDQSADSTSKKGLILSVGIQLMGATLFGFIIAATRRIVQFIAPIQKATTRNLQEISEYAVDRRLPDGISSRIKRHFRYFYFKTSVFDERAVMRHVPLQLCQEVVEHTHAAALTAAGLLQDHDFPPLILMRLARALKPMELDAGDEALRQGDVVLQVYFVIRGRVEAYLQETRGDVMVPMRRRAEVGLQRMSYLGVWGPGSLWGLNNVLLGGYAEASFVAATATDLLWLDQADLIAVMAEYPATRESLEKTATIQQSALHKAVSSETIKKEGLKLQQISLMDFKASDLKQQLKHTDVISLCTLAAADQANSGSRRRSVVGGKASLAQELRNMASLGFGVKGSLSNILATVRRGFGGSSRGRMQQRLVRTWRTGTPGFYSQVHNWMGQEVKGVMETEETPEELNRRLIMLPDQPFKLRWDAGVSMVCVLVAIFTPYRMAFADNDSVLWLVFDAAVDTVFLVGMIVRNYLRGSLVMDVASTVPIYVMGVAEKAFRGLFVLKLLRVGRVLSLAEQLHRLSEQEAISNGRPKRRFVWLTGLNIDVPRWSLDLIQILLVIYYSAHIFGCLWWLTSRYQEEESWWVMDGLSLGDSTSTYIASLYWAVTTITTVGYGDLVPTSDLERIVACITMVCGTTMFSYVIGSVSSLVMNPTGGQVRRKLQLLNVNNYLEEKKVGESLCRVVRGHMRFIMGARSAWDEDHILTRLPPAIRERVLDHVHRDAIEVIPVLRSRTGGYVSAILRQLRPQMYLLGEMVYKKPHLSQGVYFVTKGIAEAFERAAFVPRTGGESRSEDKVKGHLSVGGVFGYNRYLAPVLEENLAIRAFSQLQVYLLSHTSIRYFLSYHPFLAKDLRNELEQAIFDQTSEEIDAENVRILRDADGDEAPRARPISALAEYLLKEATAGVRKGESGDTPPLPDLDGGRLEGASGGRTPLVETLGDSARASQGIGAPVASTPSRPADGSRSSSEARVAHGDPRKSSRSPGVRSSGEPNPVLNAAAMAVAAVLEDERKSAAESESRGGDRGHERISHGSGEPPVRRRSDAQDLTLILLCCPCLNVVRLCVCHVSPEQLTPDVRRCSPSSSEGAVGAEDIPAETEGGSTPHR